MRSSRRSTNSSRTIASRSSSARSLVAVAGLPLLYFLKFDFNPINLRNPKVESIATFLDLRKDPNTGANAINVLTNSEADAKKIEAQAGEAAGSAARACRSTASCPTDQPAKLKLIAQARQGADARAQSGIRSMRRRRSGKRRVAEELGRTACARRRATARGRARSPRAGLRMRWQKLADADQATREQGAGRLRRRR